MFWPADCCKKSVISEPFQHYLTIIALIKPQDRTDYQWSEADTNLCDKSQKFVPTPERRNLDKKITECLEFSRKFRLAVYFDKRGKGKETSYEGEECWETDFDGEGPWTTS